MTSKPKQKLNYKFSEFKTLIKWIFSLVTMVNYTVVPLISFQVSEYLKQFSDYMIVLTAQD